MHYDIDLHASFCDVCMAAKIKGLQTKAHSKDEAFIACGFKYLDKTTKRFRIHEDLDCHKDYSSMTIPSETNQKVKESLDEASVNENLKNRRTFVTILQNMQCFFRQTMAFRGNKNSKKVKCDD